MLSYVSYSNCDSVITYSNESVNVALFLLTISPHPGHGLVIICWVPIWVKHYQSVGTDQVQATTSSFTTQHEDKFPTLEKNQKNHAHYKVNTLKIHKSHRTQSVPGDNQWPYCSVQQSPLCKYTGSHKTYRKYNKTKYPLW